MAPKLQEVLLFLLLLAFQEMVIVPGEAAMCEAPSRLFNGLCFSSKNCQAICEKEKFTSGKCRFLKCVCSKDCNTGGGGGGPGHGPPGGEEPPEEGPPGSDEPPAEGPPGSEEPPEQGPPGGEEPPEEGPPSSGEPPEEGPSVAKAPHFVNRKSKLLAF